MEAGKGRDHVVAGKEKKIDKQVKGGIEKCIEAEEAPETNKPGKPRRKAADWLDEECTEQKIDRPIASEMDEHLDWIGIKKEALGNTEAHQPKDRSEAKKMSEYFE